MLGSPNDIDTEGKRMLFIATIIHVFFPFIALILLIVGVKRKAINYVISSLGLSIIALFIHYQSSNSQILGTYFNYYNTLIFSLGLIVLSCSSFYVLYQVSIEKPALKYITGLVQAFIALASILISINVWINAYFIENKLEGTPIIQAGLIKKVDYCSYKYIFYKIGTDGSVFYLCPNYYGLLPRIGYLNQKPDFIATQLSIPSKKQMLLLQQKKN